jgi:tetratricopeptide (TPR) repeat protein
VSAVADLEARGDARRARWILLALVVAVLATYASVGAFGWVRYDDPDYVRDNPVVGQGLTVSGFTWAFGARASNWHPLTWLAHMLDVELFGLDPGAHHWSSVALHALASVLCFLALRALTRHTWRAAAVAALFALHPLRVESVAWISERKDVLSGCAFFALLLAYVHYVRAPSAARYALLLALLALGLLAKPMLVSAPLVLLLLDLWPLARRAQGVSGVRLVLEKLPLVALAATSAVLTVWAQRVGGSLGTLEAVPLEARLANAPLALVRYLAHFVWPAELAYFYPHRAFVAAEATPWTVAVWGALALVLALTALAAALARRRPFVPLGWAWFLVMLLPVLGLVQVGEQALADRYAYLPVVGLQLVVVYALAELAARRPALLRPLVAAGVLALLALGLASARQAHTWRNSEALFRRALAVTERNYPAWNGLANELLDQGRLDEARTAYEAALAIRPSYGPALYGLGLLEQRRGDLEAALARYRAATEAMPGYAPAHLNLGGLLASRGEVVEAAEAFERVLALVPGQPDAHLNLAQLLLFHGRAKEAAEHLERALRAQPGNTFAWEKLGDARLRLGELEAARAALERALRNPTRADAARLLAALLVAPGPTRDAPRALELARRAVGATQRRDPRALQVLARVLAASGDPARAAEVEEESLPLLTPPEQEAARQRAAAYRRGEAPR